MKMLAISALSCIEGLLYRRDLCCSLVTYSLVDSLLAQHFLRHDQYQLFTKVVDAYNQSVRSLLSYFEDDRNKASKALSQALFSLCSQDIPADLASLMLLQWRRGTAMRDANLLTARLECLCEYLGSTVEGAVENMLASHNKQQLLLPHAHFILPHVPRPDCSYEEWHVNRLEHLQFIFQSKDEDNDEVDHGNQPRSLQDLASSLPERDKFILRSRWSRLDIVCENEDILRVLSQVITFALEESASLSSSWHRPAIASLKIVKLLITQTLSDKENQLRMVHILLLPMVECIVKLPALNTSKVLGSTLDTILMALTSKRFPLLQNIIIQYVSVLVEKLQPTEQIFIDKQILDILAFVDLDEAIMQKNVVNVCYNKVQVIITNLYAMNISRKEISCHCCEIVQALQRYVINLSTSSTATDQVREVTQQVLTLIDIDTDINNEIETTLLQLCIATNDTMPAAYDVPAKLQLDIINSNSLHSHYTRYLQLLYLSKQPQSVTSNSALISQMQLLFDHISASIAKVTVIDGLIRRRTSQYQQLSLITLHTILSSHCLSDSESIAMALQIISKLQGSLGIVAQQFLQRTIMTMYQACFSDRMISNEMQDHVTVVMEALVTSQKMNAWVMSKIEDVNILFPLHPLWMLRALLGLPQPVFGSWMILISRVTGTVASSSQRQLSKQIQYEQLYLLMKLMRTENSLSWSFDTIDGADILQKEIVRSYSLILSYSINTILDSLDYNQTECEDVMTKFFCSENTLNMSSSNLKELPAAEQSRQMKLLKKRQLEGMLSFCQNLLDCSLNQIEIMELQTIAIMTLTMPIMPPAFRRKAWEELGLLKLFHLADDMNVMQVIAPVWIKSLRKQIVDGSGTQHMTAREYAVQEEICRCLQTLRGERSLQQCYAVVNLAMISLSVFVLHELLAQKDVISNPYATALLLQVIFAQGTQQKPWHHALLSLFKYWLARVAKLSSPSPSFLLVHVEIISDTWNEFIADCLLDHHDSGYEGDDLVSLQEVKIVLTKDYPESGLRAGEVSLATILNL